jgi:hypothetical protein
MCEIFFLQPVDNAPATKRHHWTGAGWTTDAAPTTTWWRAVKGPVIDSVDTLAVSLRAAAERNATTLWGVPKGPLPDDRIVRRNNETFGLPDEGRDWLCVDVDELDAPDWLAGRSPQVDELPRLANYVRQSLPEPFRVARCVYQYSASAGIRPWGKVKAHLWFCLSRPLCAAGVKSHLLRGGCDPSLYRAAQPYFIAPPVCTGAPDPLAGHRWGILDGDDRVVVPASVPSPEQIRAERARQDEADAAAALAARGRVDMGAASGDALAALDASVAAILDSGKTGRHPAMVTAAGRMAGWVKAGAIDEVIVVDALVEAFATVKPEGRAEGTQVWQWAMRHAKPRAMGQFVKLDEPVGQLVDTLDELRAATRDAVRAGVFGSGVSVVRAEPGAGKTTALVDTLAGAYRRGRYVIAARDRAAVDERIAELVAAGVDREQIVRDVGRADDTCDEFGPYLRAARVAPGAAVSFCHQCPRFPYSEGGAGTCRYWREREVEAEHEPRITVTTHALLPKWRAPSTAGGNVAVDWGRVRTACQTGERVVPWVKQTETGWRLTVQPEPFGITLPLLRTKPRDWYQPDDAGQLRAVPFTDDERDVLFQALGDFLGCDGTLAAVVEALQGSGYVVRPDAIIVDEDASGAVAPTYTLTGDDLRAMWAAGEFGTELDGFTARKAAINALSDLITRSTQGERFTAGDVAAAAAGLYVADGYKAEPDADGNVRDYRALDALAAAIARGWGGCYVTGGRLYVATLAPLDDLAAVAVVLLDGTATELGARAVFGPGRFVAIARRWEGVVVEHVPVKLGKRALSSSGQWESGRKAALWQALRLRYDGPKTLWLGSKGYAPAGAFEGISGAFTHYLSRAAVGSNAFVDADTVVLTSYRTNDLAMTARAEVYAAALDVGSADALAAVRRQSESAVVEQALHRIRPTLADAANVKRVVVVDTRTPTSISPALAGYTTSDVDDLLFSVGYAAGKGGARAVLRALVEKAGFWCQNWRSPAFQAALDDVCTNFPLLDKGVLGHTPSNPAFQAGEVEFLAKNYHGRDWGKFAADAGLFSAVVEHGNGQAVTFVFCHEPSVDDVRQAVAAVAPEGLQWARYRGVVVYGDAAVRAAAVSVPGLATMTAGDAWAALGAVLGVSGRRARERVRAVGLTLDDLRAMEAATSVVFDDEEVDSGLADILRAFVGATPLVRDRGRVLDDDWAVVTARWANRRPHYVPRRAWQSYSAGYALQ